jgi:hypothetical protein
MEDFESNNKHLYIKPLEEIKDETHKNNRINEENTISETGSGDQTTDS